MKIPCDFKVLPNGRLKCKKHNQTLLYITHNSIICQVGEDELISQYGLGKYLRFMRLRKARLNTQIPPNTD